MSGPISPAACSGRGDRELPAYVSNGLIGLRVRPMPLLQGMALVSGYAGEHPERRIEAAAVAPYPLAGDLAVDGVWLSDVPHQVRDLSQAYDFASGELTSRFTLRAAGRVADLRGRSPSAAARIRPWSARRSPSGRRRLRPSAARRGRRERDRRPRAAPPARHAGRSRARLRRRAALGKPGRPRTRGLRLRHRAARRRRPGEPARPALAGDRLSSTYSFRGAPRRALPPAPDRQPRPRRPARPARPAGRAPGRQGPVRRVRGDPRREPRGLGGALEGPHPAGRRRRRAGRPWPTPRSST